MSTKGITSKEPDPRIVYADIIDLPHHQSPTRPHMSLYDRAAQFSAFDPLTGYSEMISEEARLTDRKMELEEYELDVLNQKLNLISHRINEGRSPEITVTFFVPDERKTGGSYQSHTGIVKKIDPITQTMIFYDSNGHANGKIIDLAQVIELHSDLLDEVDHNMATP